MSSRYLETLKAKTQEAHARHRESALECTTTNPGAVTRPDVGDIPLDCCLNVKVPSFTTTATRFTSIRRIAYYKDSTIISNNKQNHKKLCKNSL